MSDDNLIPIGERLGSERLFDEHYPPPDQMTPDSPPPPKRRKRRKPANPPPPEAAERAPAAKQAEAKWREMASTGLEITGIGLFSAGFFMIAPYLGLIVLGVCIVVFGVALGYARR